MIDSPYVAQAERGLNLLVGSVRGHHQALARKGFLGDTPTQEQFRAALFEVGCLHLFVLDQVLRTDYPEDTFLGDTSMMYGNWLLSMFPESHDNPTYGELLSNRLHGYAQSIAWLTDKPRDEETLRDDVLYSLTAQLLRSLWADDKADGEVFMGQVETAGFDAAKPDHERRYLLRGIKETLYEHLLPLQQAGVLWSDETPFYQKSLDELDARVPVAARQALDVWRGQCEPRNEVFSPAWWAAQHDRAVTFRLLAWPGSAPTNWEEGMLTKEYDPNRFPYLRVAPDPAGMPLRKLLLLAHSLRAGLVAQENDGDSDREPLDVRLSLGGVDALLRGGSAALVLPEGSPDISEPDALSIVPTNFYSLPTPARLSLFRLYFDARQKMRFDAENLTPPQPWDPLVARLGPQLRPLLESTEATLADENDAGIRASWVSDARGVGALAVGPVQDDEVVHYIRWLVSPGTALIAEPTPILAQFPIGYSKEGNVSGTRGPMEAPTAAGQAIAGDPSARFVRTNEMIYGPMSGEPYDVLRRTDDTVVGHPLLAFALGAYDGGQGLALRDEDDTLIWWNSFGEVITFLWEQELEADHPAPAAVVKETPAPGRKRGRIGGTLLPPPMQPARVPDLITIPDLSRANIAWVLARRGVPLPQMGMVKENGETKLYFGPPPPVTDDEETVRWRIGWYLPRGSRNFEFQYHPVLIPAPMPYTAP